MEIRSLTRAEAEIMKILWKLQKAFVKEILAQMPDPKPAYNTVATFIKILEKKNIVSHITYGSTHQYFPLITEEEYKRHEVEQLMGNYFENSAANLVSFFFNDKKLNASELDEIMEFVKKNNLGQ
ncbi:BlaI/MecI/CopY family transcriptional regulator [Runella sp. MFBS21]|uniref:BlaI/MecI/CopY family transcriptional regulator n=1 Tax=Runella sp. MFBS21 TaxID=3034018 RepID=UPI0023FA451B|nr:BlaI/MecI/CopY family transcriptional regulator [Runella sp. MFBS21]MDF7819303.1 BlaI/MecI/CopY family transcriptional regulator [Runella sp. MFBS21]